MGAFCSLECVFLSSQFIGSIFCLSWKRFFVFLSFVEALFWFSPVRGSVHVLMSYSTPLLHVPCRDSQRLPRTSFVHRLTAQIARLTGLQFLNMAANRLTRLPSEIGQLSALRRLGLKGNALVRLPSSIGDLSLLVELYLTGNILEALPNEVSFLPR